MRLLSRQCADVRDCVDHDALLLCRLGRHRRLGHRRLAHTWPAGQLVVAAGHKQLRRRRLQIAPSLLHMNNSKAEQSAITYMISGRN